MSRTIPTFLGALALTLASAVAGIAQDRDFTALAHVDTAGSRIAETADGLRVDLALSQGVPWRVYTLTDPPRAVFDFREVDWSGVDPEALMPGAGAEGLRFGTVRPGWSRLVIELRGPLSLDRAALKVSEDTGKAMLTARFADKGAGRFAAVSGAPADDPLWSGTPAPKPRGRPGEGPLTVVIDAGHGGIDPGAEREGLEEKNLMLSLARDLSDTLIRAGGFNVVMTRADDSFISLERRVEIAHEAGAHVFISLHADALSEGRARGTTVHTLSSTASDEASAKLAERHDRDDLLAGVDLTGKDDQVADVLMDLARQETRPRTARLARTLVATLATAEIPRNSKPIRSAGFSVLKAADIPSVLIEVGFLSDDRDRRNLADPVFRARFAGAVRDALVAWMREDASLAPLVRH